MPTYEVDGFEPPAPVVRVTVSGQPNVPMLIDTGADISVVPLQVVEALGIETRPSAAPVQFLDGQQVTCPQADLTVEFLRYRFHGPFLIAESEYGVLGRNILNLLVLKLDGPNLSWSLGAT
jgi:predicted aspartyl protease